ncbi:MAG: hypothetical protein H7A20_00285 [Rhodanobacteraceae bacterium]|nr:hypothetical protein [Xanthomonadales bacterium]MCP5477225.1 hypothetical protein [Rhodanobacteraceae bacterium]HPF74480.1 hypothetical protein [Xanthomonadaceae bacterium]HRY00829.1 hypothetical protein [Xanthomonadaceae bacterium]
MNTLLARFSMRLALPALLLCGLAALGDPLPAPAEQRIEQLSETLVRKADSLMERAEANKDTVRGGGSNQTATAMRLLMTMPAFTRRCITSCTD